MVVKGRKEVVRGGDGKVNGRKVKDRKSEGRRWVLVPCE